MKIIALRVQPIARTLAIVYAAFGLLFWIAFCLNDVEYITLPVGVIAPLLNFNFNFNFHRSHDVVHNALLLLGSILSYALSGWLTAAAAVICFNVVARWKGGIDADFISLRQKRKSEVVIGQ
jgi:hypothetical protein